MENSTYRVEIDDFFGAYKSRGFNDLRSARQYAMEMSVEYDRVSVLAYSKLTFRWERI